MLVVLPEEKAENILTIGSGTLWEADGTDDYVIAFDVGTTTVVGYLLDGRSAAVLATVSAPNPQREFGADVISRIQYALTVDAAPLQRVILDTLGSLIGQAAQKSEISPGDISLISLVGNTCMHHLTLGIDTKPLATPPTGRMSQHL